MTEKRKNLRDNTGHSDNLTDFKKGYMKALRDVELEISEAIEEITVKYLDSLSETMVTGVIGRHIEELREHAEKTIK